MLRARKGDHARSFLKQGPPTTTRVNSVVFMLKVLFVVVTRPVGPDNGEHLYFITVIVVLLFVRLMGDADAMDSAHSTF